MNTKLVFAILFLAAFVPAQAQYECTQTYSNRFFRVMNGCYQDTTKHFIPSAIAEEVLQWLEIHQFLLYVLLCVLIIPGICNYGLDDTSIQSDSAARANRIRLNTINLLYRLGLGLSISAWMSIAIRQPTPCSCVGWGMPSSGTIGASIIAMFLIEYVTVPYGIIIPILVSGAEIALGWHSIGQTLAGLAIGFAIHFLTSRTPLYLRFVEIILNLIAGFLTFFLIPKVDRSSVFMEASVEFYNGVLWQIFAISLIFILYDWIFVRSILPKSCAGLDIPDFLYYVPLNEPSSAQVVKSPGDSWVLYIAIPLLFLLLSALNIADEYLPDFYNL